MYAGGADGVSAINTVSGLMTVKSDATPWPAVGKYLFIYISKPVATPGHDVGDISFASLRGPFNFPVVDDGAKRGLRRCAPVAAAPPSADTIHNERVDSQVCFALAHRILN